tara:strand:+ start:227 stop:538 length:312 start_codon:yes stop_codon:yes gene_type:complete
VVGLLQQVVQDLKMQQQEVFQVLIQLQQLVEEELELMVCQVVQEVQVVEQEVGQHNQVQLVEEPQLVVVMYLQLVPHKEIMVELIQLVVLQRQVVLVVEERLL